MKRPDFTRGFIPEQTQQERLRAPPHMRAAARGLGTHFLLPEVRLLQSTLWGRFPCLGQLTAATNSGGPCDPLTPWSQLFGG